MTLVFRWIAWTLLVAVAVFTLCPIAYRPTTGVPADVERAFAFFVLGAAIFVAYRRCRPLAMLLVTLWTAAIEAGQLLVPGRHARLRDFMIKALAVFLGAMAVSAFERLRRSR